MHKLAGEQDTIAGDDFRPDISLHNRSTAAYFAFCSSLRETSWFMLVKIIVIIIFVCGLVLTACFDSKPARYSIAGSKTYEAALFRQNCSICHGPEAEGKTLEDGRVIPNLRQGDFKYKTNEQIYHHISEGGNGMVPFKNMLTQREINMLVELVQKELRKQTN